MLRVLISIKSTMIIDGGHHGIRLYEGGTTSRREIFVGIDICKLNHFAAAISSDSEILIETVQILKRR